MTVTTDRSVNENSSSEGKTMKIVADKHKCIGAGTCVVIAPDLFDQDDEGIVEVLVEEPGEEQLGVLNEAIEYCPAQALLLSRD